MLLFVRNIRASLSPPFCSRFDFDRNHIMYDTKVPLLTILGDYEISGRILLLPISGKGDINITLSKNAEMLLRA
jgi:hypothetical protein